jgi:hypothetical protein
MCPCEANNPYTFHSEIEIVASSLDGPGLGSPFSTAAFILPRATLL